MTEEILAITEGFVNDDSIEAFQYIEKRYRSRNG